MTTFVGMQGNLKLLILVVFVLTGLVNLTRPPGSVKSYDRHMYNPEKPASYVSTYPSSELELY